MVINSTKAPTLTSAPCNPYSSSALTFTIEGRIFVYCSYIHKLKENQISNGSKTIIHSLQPELANGISAFVFVIIRKADRDSSYLPTTQGIQAHPAASIRLVCSEQKKIPRRLNAQPSTKWEFSINTYYKNQY